MNQQERLKAAEATWERHENQKALCYRNSEVDRIAIERFIAGAEAEAESKWVSVSDRLPEPEQRLLVVANKGVVFIMYYGLLNEKGDYGWFYDDEIIKPYMTPTHWQPLPQPTP